VQEGDVDIYFQVEEADVAQAELVEAEFAVAKK
jgi:hypothetical protein